MLETDDPAHETERLSREIELLRARLSNLSEVSLRIAETLDIEGVLQKITDSARLLTNASHATLVTLQHIGRRGRALHLRPRRRRP